MNFKMIRYTLGVILKFEALFFLVPIITALCYREEKSLNAFVATAGICLFLGYFMTYSKPSDKALRARDGFVIVSLSWIILSLFGAVPFLLSGAIPNYIDALFETVSGFTTTGASILDGAVIESLDHAVLIWRSFTHWVGGMGVLVFVMAIMPLSGAQNMHIMRAESPGPEVSKLVPRVRRTALILYFIYFIMTVALFLVLLLDNSGDGYNKVTVFDALCTAFGTAGTGGFGIKADSLASYSPYVQIVCTVFLILFSINFNSYYLILKKKWKDAFNTEVIVFLGLVVAAVAIIMTDVMLNDSLVSPTGEAIPGTFFGTLRHAAFTVSTCISTCGFSTVDFQQWSALSHLILLLLMFIGGCAGSTAGGLKASRVVILFKAMIREFGNLIHPNRVKKISIDDKPLEDEAVRSVLTYLATYVFIFFGSLLLISIDQSIFNPAENTFMTNFSAVTCTFNNIGPGLDFVGPTQNFADFSPISKLILSFDMLAGRLELFPMLILFTPSTWKK